MKIRKKGKEEKKTFKNKMKGDILTRALNE